MTNSSINNQGRWIIVVGGIVLASGLALTAFGIGRFVFEILDGKTDALQQMKAPGTATVEINKPGPIVIYQESLSTVGNERQNYGSDLRRMSVSARDENGQSVAVAPVDSTERYQIGDRKGISVWKFEAPVSGNYTVEIQLPSGMQGEFDIAVGPSMLSGGISSLLGSFLGLFGGIALDALGSILIIVGMIMRSRSKRRTSR